MWLKGLRRCRHSGADTTGTIKSYHGALKRWMKMDRWGTQGRRLDWLIAKLNKSVQTHYLYKLDLKALGFVKNKKIAEIVTNSVFGAKSIKDENIKLPEEDRGPWLVQSTKDAAIWYKVYAPCTEYACCNCEWSIRGNFCKHQVAILKGFGISIDIIIEFCGTWYGTNQGGVIPMFGACHIPDAKDPFGELEDDDGFQEEDVEGNLRSWEDPNFDGLEETMEENIIVQDTYEQEISKVMKQFKKGAKEMEDLMQEGGLHLAHYGMAEFRILLGKMRALNVNGANDHLHPRTHFQTMDDGVPNTIRRHRD